MHELSIAQSIVDAVHEQAAPLDGRRVARIGVRVGEVSGVNADALDFCFGIAAKDTAIEGAVLEIERVPVRFRCAPCATEFVPVEFKPECPACGSTRTSMIAGEELALSFLDLE